MTFVTLPLVPRFWLIPKWSQMVLILQRNGLVLWMLILQLRILCQQIYLIWTFFFESPKAEKETFEKKPEKNKKEISKKKSDRKGQITQNVVSQKDQNTSSDDWGRVAFCAALGVIVRMVSLSQASSWGVYLFGIWHFGQCLVLATSPAAFPITHPQASPTASSRVKHIPGLYLGLRVAPIRGVQTLGPL